MTADPNTRNPIEELADEFAQRFRRGERPSISEYTQKYPQLADEIRDLFPALEMMEELAPAHSPPTPVTHSEFVAPDSVPLKLGDFRIVREIGAGGMGVVYEALQVSLGRTVALKVPPAHTMKDPVARERFLREAQAAARLHHTNIVPVFAVGEQEEQPYYAMQYIDGKSLRDVIAELRRRQTRSSSSNLTRTPNEQTSLLADAVRTGVFHAGKVSTDRDGDHDSGQPRTTKVEDSDSAHSAAAIGFLYRSQSPFFASAARIGLQAAQALAYSHEQGILHRDVKPANLMIDTAGVVWITDFGLAKAEGQEDLTSTGDVVGTLRYLAPERFKGQADARSDVCSLGLTLYELLTLQPAFPESDRSRLVQQILQSDPLPPRRINPTVPGDLETIVLKCMQKEPHRRYASAGALAEDLQRFLLGEPIQARRVTLRERFGLWVRRRPALAGLSAMSFLALVCAVAFGIYFNFSRQLSSLNQDLSSVNKKLQNAVQAESKTRKREERERKRAEAAEGIALRASYNNAVLLAHKEWEKGNILLARRLHESCLASLRGWEWRYLQRLFNQESAVFSCSQAPRLVALSRDGQYLAWVEQFGSLIVVNTGTGKTLLKIDKKGRPVSSAIFLPDKNKLAIRTLLRRFPKKSVLQMWDLASGLVIREIADSGDTDKFIACSPDGRRLASAESRKVWDVATGKPLFFLEGDRLRPRRIVFDSSGKWIAGSAASKVFLWDGKNGKLLNTFEEHRNVVTSISFTSATILTTVCRSTVRRWDCRQRKLIRTTKNQRGSYGHATALRPGGRFVAGAQGKTITLWNLSTGKDEATFRGAAVPYSALAFSGDGKYLAAGSFDKTIRLYLVDRRSTALTMWAGRPAFSDMAFHPHGDRLASTAVKNAVKIWHLNTSEEIRTIRAPHPIRRIAYSPSGKWLAFGCDVKNRAGKILTFNADGQPLWTRSTKKPVRYLATNRQGDKLASLSGKSVQIWDVVSRKEIASFDHSSVYGGLAWSPVGDLLAVGCKDGSVSLLDANSAKEMFQLKAQSNGVACLAFNHDGSRLASGDLDATIKVWDPVSRKLLFNLVGHSYSMSSLAFSPQGDRLISGGMDGVVNLWDTATGQLVLSLTNPQGIATVYGVAFSPNGHQIAIIDSMGKVHVFSDVQPANSAPR